MTSKGETQETSEFLRRRQLRLQQVREQSKDIAKKIRQRAKVEKLRQVVHLDERKEREYKQSQEKVVKKLEELYSRGLSNVGSSHKQARGLTQPVNVIEKVDPSQLRGREAAAEVKRQKQQKLDELKKALDRKLHAREAANELSREKTAYTANKLSGPPSNTNIVHEGTKSTSENVNGDLNLNNKDLPEEVSRTDMGTQWDADLLPPEWEPNVPALTLPREDDFKESAGDKDNATDKHKKTDLFAVSDEMPTSLRGGSVKSSDTGRSKFTSTLVTEYIQNRVLRLRDTEVSTSKQQLEDLKNLRQTISRSRPLRPAVPDNGTVRAKESDNVTRKKSVTTYNHSTRDTRAVPVPGASEPVVYRDRSPEQDAYSLALSASMSACNLDKQKRYQQSSNKVAVTKQNVEKEYKDTIAFLNSLPKNKHTRPINNAYKDDHRLQAQRENRQKILQEEFRHIEEECRRQSSQGYKSKSSLSDKHPSQHTKSSADSNVDNNLDERDFCYSWMPVPDSDSKLAVHTIPTGGRAGPSVKFSVDSYHEYRSRHKHTPPTKDTAATHHTHAASGRKLVQTVILQNDEDCSSDESVASRNSSTDAHPPPSDPKQNVNNDDSPKGRELTDTERIIIYKILNHKQRKRNKAAKVNSTSDVNQDNEGTKATRDEKMKQSANEEAVSKDEHDEHARGDNNPLHINRLTEGVYEVSGRNKDNLESQYLSRLDKAQPSSSDNKCDKLTQGSSSCSTDAGDVPLQSRKKCSSVKCKGHNPKSQVTSESYASASADTAAAAVASAHNAGLVKLIDDVQKQGNIYIGATGFLKNDAYEVIIQLRKNDTTKEVVKTQDVPGELLKADIRNDNTKISKFEVAPSSEQKDEVQQKVLIDDSNPSVATAPPPPSPLTNQDSGANPTDNEKQLLSSAVSEDVQSTKTTQDRSVATSFNEIIPESVGKSEPIARPAMSTCTQTTPSPSNPRPVYIHMSSSTSTAYMSPPEVVLPHFFKRGDKPCRKARRSRNIEKKEESNFISHEHHCKSYSCCKIFEKMAPKPKIDRLNYYADIYREKNEFAPSSSVGNYNCSKRNTRGVSEVCCKHHIRNHMKHHLNAAKQNTCTCSTKNGVLQSKMNKSRHASMLSSQSYLSPMIKQYIRKLLSLNREGIKAIQIMSQNCSSVNTPASSIINMPTNFSANNFSRDELCHGNRDWERFESILKQRVFLHDNATHAIFSRPDNATGKYKIVKNIKPRIRNSNKKRVHKVKSLNISKRIVVKTTNVSTNTKDDNCAIKLLSNVESSERDLTPTDHIKIYDKSSNKNDTLENRTTSKTIHKRPSNKYVVDTFSSAETKAASNNNSNDDMSSKPINISTQTSCTVDGEINFIKLAEDKLQNMEKIADLTEKCTKRLSNLAKVLEEVRKNKSIAYSQVSTPDSASDSDQKSDKASEKSDCKKSLNTRESTVKSSKNQFDIDSVDYESLIPGVQLSGNIQASRVKTLDNDLYENSNSESISQSVSSVSTNDNCRESSSTKCRNRPPPALLRVNLKRPQDKVVPHELSTVMEVDSPLSVKFKQLSPINTQSNNNLAYLTNEENGTLERQTLPESSINVVNKSSNERNKVMFRDSSEDSKLQMMDINQFNEIMLKPFVSLQEYARGHYDRSAHTKREITDDISSLHSDGSLPDVVAELLRRKLITEPFRFDTASNMNSTTISSESTLSVLALSKVKKDNTKSKLTANKENVDETSDSLSISSNPDLENAFKKLGMGWASSTLKKTKERLALSSSSNTSSSSLSQLKLKNSTKQDVAVAEAAWSVSNISKKTALKRRLDTSKNVEQQTSFANNMSVKEFLTKELANKITFTDKSNRNDTNQEFVSMYETKLPDNLKNSSQNIIDNNSGDAESALSGNNRARTSTPVKIFKSVTYHSSSSSNMSNGLFSNADELSSVKLTPASVRHQSASEKDELTIPNCSLKMRKTLSDCSKTDSS